VIARHVDHLDPSEREALEAAAAVGIEFTASAVADALQQKVEYVRRVLGPMARRGHLLVAVGAVGAARAVGSGGQARVAQTTYRFRHALYADLIAQQAPMLRQLRVVERLSRVRELDKSDAGRRRA
jgi:hypothetical protein